MSFMPKLVASTVLAGALAGTVCAADANLRDAVECSPRAGLPNFLAKLEKGGPVKIAYLGGSITSQAGWRVKSLAYFNAKYPKAKCEEIHAAIGGTGSDLGVLRIDHDVFKFKPDLLFVEFATNDGGSKDLRYMEGIVRKTWREFPNCDICFVYTVAGAPAQKALEEGKLYIAASEEEKVADHYGIPSICMGFEAAKLAKAGKLVWKQESKDMDRVSGSELDVKSKTKVGKDGKIPFADDGVHPYLDTGHQLYEEAIERSMPLIAAASKSVGPHATLPAPMDAGNYEQSKMYEADAAKLDGQWTKLPPSDGLAKQFGNRVDSLWKAEPGAGMSFKFKGSAAKLYYLLGPGCGSVEITVDGKSRKANCIDPYCTYFRLGLMPLCDRLAPDAVHEVTVKVLGDKLDKRTILFEKNRPDFDKNPAKYEANDLYVGALFIIGELVK
jgi:hypothetical protein